MNKITIAIDIDDVLAEGTNALIDVVNSRYGLALSQGDYHAVGGNFNGYYERVWATHGVDGIVSYAELADEMAADQSHIPLLPGADFAINELSKRFHIVLITARPESWIKATRRWLARHFDAGDIEVYFAGNTVSAAQKTALSKGKQAKLLNAKLLIDDNVNNCQSAMDEGIEVILFGEYGWQGDAPERMMRCKDWPAVLEHVNEARF